MINCKGTEQCKDKEQNVGCQMSYVQMLIFPYCFWTKWLLLYFVQLSPIFFIMCFYFKPGIKYMLSPVKNNNKKIAISALHVLKEVGLIMKLFRTAFLYSLFIFFYQCTSNLEIWLELLTSISTSLSNLNL